MAELLEQVAKLAELQKRATPGPWFDNIENLTKGEWAHVFGPSSLTHTECLHWPNAAFIAAAGSLDFAALHAALSPAPVAAGGAGEALSRVKDEAIEQLGLALAVRPAAFEAVREAAKSHEGVYMSGGVATRLISIMDAAKVVHDLAHAAARPATAAAVAAEAGGWIAVSERLPEAEGEYLVYGFCTDSFPRRDMALYGPYWEGGPWSFHKATQPTHWRELPAAPAQEGGQDA